VGKVKDGKKKEMLRVGKKGRVKGGKIGRLIPPPALAPSFNPPPTLNFHPFPTINLPLFLNLYFPYLHL
jgi:hypothetical protein